MKRMNMLRHRNGILSALTKSIFCTIAIFMLILFGVSGLNGCAYLGGEIAEMKGSIKGNTYTATFYSNDGEQFMEVVGEQIDMEENVVRERTYSDTNGWGYNEVISSVIGITIDGNEMASCGSTIVFAEDGLVPDVDYKKIEKINSESDGSLDDYTFVANIVNEYKNMIGKPMAVVIQSQLGDPICSYSGNDIYWEVCEDLPKTTKLVIDGKLLYIHRANFQLIDIDLLK